MHNLILTIFCSTAIALILKINSNKNGNSFLLLTGNYFAASIVSLILFLADNNSTSSVELIPLGFFLSLLFVGSIFAFSISVSLSGAAISTVSSRLSVFVPIVLSAFFFNEFPTHFQFLGLVLTIVTILFFYFSISRQSIKSENKNRFFYLLSILIGIGIADFFMKVFQENWLSYDKPWFLFWIFFFSFLITLTIVLIRKIEYDKSTLLLGCIMGVPNIFSSFFLIESLKEYSAIFVYPFVNISIIVLTAIVVKVFWKEKWNTLSKLAMFAGLVAIYFLSL